jgi:hypothetical protein
MTVVKNNSHVAIKYIGVEDEYSYQQVYEGRVDCLNNLGGICAFIKKGQNVLIKVNAVNANKAKSGVTVSPLLCRALVELSYKESRRSKSIYGPYFIVGDCTLANWKESGKTIMIPGCCPGGAIRSTILLEYGIQ